MVFSWHIEINEQGITRIPTPRGKVAINCPREVPVVREVSLRKKVEKGNVALFSLTVKELDMK